MPQLTTNEATPSATFGASKTSKVFTCGDGVMHLYISGTAGGGTLTLEACRTQDGDFDTYYVDNVSGTPTAQEFTVTEVPADSVYHRCYLEHGMYFRTTTDSDGTQSWEIEVNGTHVRILE